MSRPFTASRSAPSTSSQTHNKAPAPRPALCSHTCTAVPQHHQQQPSSSDSSSLNRREWLTTAGLTAAAVATLPLVQPQRAAAAGFKKELKKRKIPLEDYTVSDVDGLRYYDTEQGRGKAIAAGDTVVVHFDCKFRGIDAVSSRYARTLGGNRTIAEPLKFVAGQSVNVYTKKADTTAGGLFAGGSGPKPPPAISTAVLGMKPGGRRIVYVDKPELGYVKGNQEIPAGAAFELDIEVLSTVTAVPGSSSSSI